MVYFNTLDNNMSVLRWTGRKINLRIGQQTNDEMRIY